MSGTDLAYGATRQRLARSAYTRVVRTTVLGGTLHVTGTEPRAPYAPATPCPILTWVSPYAPSPPYPVLTYISPYASATRCPVLTYDNVRPVLCGRNLPEKDARDLHEEASEERGGGGGGGRRRMTEERQMELRQPSTCCTLQVCYGPMLWPYARSTGISLCAQYRYQSTRVVPLSACAMMLHV
eukprot:1334985-Rhodomonas_salina.8